LRDAASHSEPAINSNSMAPTTEPITIPAIAPPLSPLPPLLVLPVDVPAAGDVEADKDEEEEDEEEEGLPLELGTGDEKLPPPPPPPLALALLLLLDEPLLLILLLVLDELLEVLADELLELREDELLDTGEGRVEAEPADDDTAVATAEAVDELVEGTELAAVLVEPADGDEPFTLRTV